MVAPAFPFPFQLTSAWLSTHSNLYISFWIPLTANSEYRYFGMEIWASTHLYPLGIFYSFTEQDFQELAIYLRISNERPLEMLLLIYFVLKMFCLYIANDAISENYLKKSYTTWKYKINCFTKLCMIKLCSSLKGYPKTKTDIFIFPELKLRAFSSWISYYRNWFFWFVLIEQSTTIWDFTSQRTFRQLSWYHLKMI